MVSTNELREMWDELRPQLVEECGRSEKKLALAEVLALRSMAARVLSLKLKLELQSAKRRKSFVR